MARVVFDHVWKKFGTAAVVRDLCLTVEQGEFLVLVGPSGCGKSTTLRMLAGLETTSDGRIFIGNRDVTNAEPRERDIAMVFQSYALYPHMSVRDNIAFGLRNRGTPASRIAEKVDTAAKMLEISHLLDRRPRELSGGQRQRVALGRAIVRDAAVFLMDEPLSNLDAQLRVNMRGEIIKLHQRLKSTTVYVTHDQVEAMTMGSRVAVLKDGELVQVDSARHLYEKPRNVFVATFIGSPSMNILDATLVRDGGPKAMIGESTIGLPAVFPETNAGKPVKIGIRPEHLKITALGAEEGSLAGEVSLVESMGDESIVTILVEGLAIRVKLHGEYPHSMGDIVSIVVDPRHVHVFDAISGERINRSA